MLSCEYALTYTIAYGVFNRTCAHKGSIFNYGTAPHSTTCSSLGTHNLKVLTLYLKHA